jgi:hypothetical protein
MGWVLKLVDTFSKTLEPVLIIGERGVGKDLVAEYLHHVSGRGLLIKVSCDEPAETLQRRLFGYVDESVAELVPDLEEAFEPGILDRAIGGTVYLDRIDLLRHECIPILSELLAGGPRHTMPDSNVRIVASCLAAPFPQFVDAYLNPKLRSFFGSNVISMPPLRDRMEDFADLLHLMVDEEAGTLGIPTLPLQEGLTGTLAGFDWVNNAAELRRFVRDVLVSLGNLGSITNEVVAEIWQRRTDTNSEPREFGRRKRCSVLAAGLSYQGHPVSASDLYDWIGQFLPYRGLASLDPRDLAEQTVRTIRNFFYYNEPKLYQLVREGINQVVLDLKSSEAWNWLSIQENSGMLLPRSLLDRVVYCDTLGPMKSSGLLSYILRQVGGLHPSRNALDLVNLPNRIESENQGLVVLVVDDFLGSGNQFTSAILPSLLADGSLKTLVERKKREGVSIKIYVIICVAFAQGVERAKAAVPSWLDLQIVCGEILGPEAKVFSSESRTFPDPTVRQEAETLFTQNIGRFLQPNAPYGHGQVQGIVVFQHNTPNNTLPIVWKSGFVQGRPWRALFPRSTTA